jgi:hypothetical protein
MTGDGTFRSERTKRDPRFSGRTESVIFTVSAWSEPERRKSWRDLVEDVVVDAKRILLRYGVPIAVLDRIEEAERIELARLVSRTAVPDRGDRLEGLLVERGYLEASTRTRTRKTRGRRKRKSG